MTTFIVDWQRPTECSRVDVDANRFRFDPLRIYTKDAFNFEMDARMIMQIDDDSAIVNDFGSFPDFVETKLSILIRLFFESKARVDIVPKRSEIQEELVTVLRNELKEYNVEIQKFIISYMLMREFLPESYTKKDIPKEVIEMTKETHSVEDVSDLKRAMDHIVLERMFLLLVILSVAILMDILSVYFGYTILAILGAIISIVAIVMNVYQYLEIRKIRTKV